MVNKDVKTTPTFIGSENRLKTNTILSLGMINIFSPPNNLEKLNQNILS